jgi:hypothetical protein
MRKHIALFTMVFCGFVSTAYGQALAGAGLGLGADAVPRPRAAKAYAAAQQLQPTALPPTIGSARLQTMPAAAPAQASRQPAQSPQPQPILAASTSAGTGWTLPNHDVITDDDVAAMRSGVAISYLWSPTTVRPGINPVKCDAACEAETRAAAGMSQSPEAAWEEQFSAARTDLEADGQWRAAYLDGLQQAHQYCVFREQQGSAVPNTASQPTDERGQYVGDMNRTLGQGLDSAAARIERQIQEAQRVDGVRAAMMEVLAERAFNQCPSEPQR